MKLFKSSDHRVKWNRFISKYDTHRYDKGEIILLQDEVPDNIRIIKSGVVKTYDIDSNGEEKTVSFDNVREIFPLGWAFKQIERTQYFYQAFTDCEVIVIPRDEFVRYLRLNPRMGSEMYADMASRFINMQSRILSLQQSKAPDKILYTLKFLCGRFGVEVKEDVALVKIALTQQELSDFIGLTRETTSLELKKLEKAGVLKYKDRNYLVNLAKLEEVKS